MAVRQYVVCSIHACSMSKIKVHVPAPVDNNINFKGRPAFQSFDVFVKQLMCP